MHEHSMQGCAQSSLWGNYTFLFGNAICTSRSNIGRLRAGRTDWLTVVKWTKLNQGHKQWRKVCLVLQHPFQHPPFSQGKGIFKSTIGWRKQKCSETEGVLQAVPFPTWICRICVEKVLLSTGGPVGVLIIVKEAKKDNCKLQHAPLWSGWENEQWA